MLIFDAQVSDLTGSNCWKKVVSFLYRAYNEMFIHLNGIINLYFL